MTYKELLIKYPELRKISELIEQSQRDASVRFEEKANKGEDTHYYQVKVFIPALCWVLRNNLAILEGAWETLIDSKPMVEEIIETFVNEEKTK